jgi:hypothetical protein
MPRCEAPVSARACSSTVAKERGTSKKWTRNDNVIATPVHILVNFGIHEAKGDC